MLFAAAPSLPLLAQEKMGSLAVKADPGRAGVFLDGKYLGPAKNFAFARTYTVAPGEHELKLEEPRYEEVTTQVMIAAGKRTTISQTMKALAPAKPPFGRVRTENADKFAAVYVNDRFMGHSGEFDHMAQYLLLNPGEYTVKIAPISGNPITQTVKVEADKIVVVK
jgi:hypothetical protein